MVLSAYQSKIFKEGCEKGVLMQYKCMEKEIRKLHGRILFPSVMYIAIIPAGMQLCQKEIKNPCIQASGFPLPLPRKPAILTGSDTIRVFVVPFDSMKKAAPYGLLFSL